MSEILVIGGRSRVASALERLYPNRYHFVVRQTAGGELMSHKPMENCAASFRSVPSYECLASEDMKGYTTVINLIGTTKGGSSEMMAVNGRLPMHLAVQAVRAEVEHFISLSSFSVYGRATVVDMSTPISPTNSYGQSRVAGELSIAQHARAMACTIVRCPMLYGAGDSKLERLIQVWRRAKIMPVPRAPVHRSMLHYDLAAKYLHEVACLKPTAPMLRTDHLADPVAFEYRMAAQVMSEAASRRIRTVTLPGISFRIFEKVLPQIYRSLFSDSILDPRLNCCSDLDDSRIERDLAAIVSKERSVA